MAKSRFLPGAAYGNGGCRRGGPGGFLGFTTKGQFLYHSTTGGLFIVPNLYRQHSARGGGCNVIGGIKVTWLYDSYETPNEPFIGNNVKMTDSSYLENWTY